VSVPGGKAIGSLGSGQTLATGTHRRIGAGGTFATWLMYETELPSGAESMGTQQKLSPDYRLAAVCESERHLRHVDCRLLTSLIGEERNKRRTV